jgi:predicted AlkP superfamily pyrophosphatase or phosphodiesterase
MSPASFTAMAFLDDRVKEIVDVLHRTGLRRRTTVIIVSDHGFRTIKHKIHLNVLLRERGFLSRGQDKQKGDAWAVAEGGTAMVYATNPDCKVEVVSELRRVFASAEGVDRIYGVEEFANIGLPVPAVSDQAPDLVLAAAPDYAFSNDPEENIVSQVAEGGTHGYLNSDPTMQAIFIAWGAGIPKGIRLNSISNLDVAPTIAALLGLEMKQARGHAIPEIVKPDLRTKYKRCSQSK